ncbi:MAG: Kae1-associated serine/threonine protein kinase [Candidatus Aenigmarchaeota archaeon]|nr:Kae1-associated serine/threonine protein kinase [Candidatus Aenigmarchaeota archaeon]
MTQIIGVGAEAVLTKKDDNTVQKTRVVKNYRHPELDLKLRKSRTRREAKVFERLSKTEIPAPKLLASNDSNMTINMSFINGQPLQSVFSQNPQGFARQIGRIIAQLHSQDIIHGDLTTSNMISTDNGLYVIDFGLSFFSQKPEDKATDIHVLFQGLRALHKEDCATVLLEAYKQNYAYAQPVLERLEKVEQRGRNKKVNNLMGP